VTTGQSNVAISHIAICTSDVARSVRFYTEALGFTLDRSIDGIGAPFDTPMGPMLFCTDPDGVRIELIQGG
jgi:catechol 2,3-dioxygenase-like lactoylglutathione lyase family enzyme